GAFRDAGGSRRVLEEGGVAEGAGLRCNRRRRPACDHGKILGPGARPRRLEEGGRYGERRRRRQEVAVCRDGDGLEACPVADGRDHRPPWVGGDEEPRPRVLELGGAVPDRKSTRLNSSHVAISYAVFCL